MSDDPVLDEMLDEWGAMPEDRADPEYLARIRGTLGYQSRKLEADIRAVAGPAGERLRHKLDGLNRKIAGHRDAALGRYFRDEIPVPDPEETPEDA